MFFKRNKILYVYGHFDYFKRLLCIWEHEPTLEERVTEFNLFIKTLKHHIELSFSKNINEMT